MKQGVCSTRRQLAAASAVPLSPSPPSKPPSSTTLVATIASSSTTSSIASTTPPASSTRSSSSTAVPTTIGGGTTSSGEALQYLEATPSTSVVVSQADAQELDEMLSGVSTAALELHDLESLVLDENQHLFTGQECVSLTSEFLTTPFQLVQLDHNYAAPAAQNPITSPKAERKSTKKAATPAKKTSGSSNHVASDHESTLESQKTKKRKPVEVVKTPPVKKESPSVPAKKVKKESRKAKLINEPALFTPDAIAKTTPPIWPQDGDILDEDAKVLDGDTAQLAEALTPQEMKVVEAAVQAHLLESNQLGKMELDVPQGSSDSAVPTTRQVSADTEDSKADVKPLLDLNPSHPVPLAPLQIPDDGEDVKPQVNSEQQPVVSGRPSRKSKEKFQRNLERKRQLGKNIEDYVSDESDAEPSPKKAAPPAVTPVKKRNGAGRPGRKPGTNAVKKPNDVKSLAADDSHLKDSSESNDETEQEQDSDNDWNSDNDPEKLWCVCRKPHNNQFMICCDSCDGWFHGKCVNVTKADATKWEKAKKDWYCEPCRKKKNLSGPPPQPVIKNESKKVNDTKKVIDVQPWSGYGVPLISDSGYRIPGVMMDNFTVLGQCAKCRKVISTDPTHRFCNKECVTKHVSRYLPDIIERAEKEKVEVRVSMVEISTGKAINLVNAAVNGTIEWLMKKPTFQINPNQASATRKITQKNPDAKGVSDVAAMSPNRLLKNNLQTKSPMPVMAVKSPPPPVRNHDTPKNEVKSNSTLNTDPTMKPVSSAPQTRTVTTPVIAKKSPPGAPSKTSQAPSTGAQTTTKQPATQSSTTSSTNSGMKNTPVKKETPVKKKETRKSSSNNGKNHAESSSGSDGKDDIEESRKKGIEMLAKILKERCLADKSMNSQASHMSELSEKIERELHKVYDHQHKNYRNKWRSLCLNLKDAKNDNLWRKVAKGDIKPQQLVKMSTDELASKELAKWREKESQHNLELYKKEAAMNVTDKDTLQLLGNCKDKESSSSSRSDGKDKRRSHESSRRSSHRDAKEKVEGSTRTTRSSSSLTSSSSRHGSRSESSHKSSSNSSKDKNDKNDNSVEAKSLSKAQKVIEQVKEFDRRFSTERPAGEFESQSPPSEDDCLNEPSERIWKGVMRMEGISFSCDFRHLTGSLGSFVEDMPSTAQICGKIQHQQVQDYLRRLKHSNKDILIIKIEPCNDEDLVYFSDICAKLRARKRLGVVDELKGRIKDFYLLPLLGDEQPPSWFPIQSVPRDSDCDLDATSYSLLGLIICHKNVRTSVASSAMERRRSSYSNDVPHYEPTPIEKCRNKTDDSERIPFLDEYDPAHPDASQSRLNVLSTIATSMTNSHGDARDEEYDPEAEWAM